MSDSGLYIYERSSTTRPRRRHRRRWPSGVLVISVRGPLPPHHGSRDIVGPRVPQLPPQAGLRRAPPLQAPPPLRECFAAGDAAMACPVCLCVRTCSVEAIRSFLRLIIRVRSSALVSPREQPARLAAAAGASSRVFISP